MTRIPQINTDFIFMSSVKIRKIRVICVLRKKEDLFADEIIEMALSQGAAAAEAR